MSEPRKQFTDHLIAADPPADAARGRYEKEVRAMLELTLSPRERGGYLLGAVAMLGLAGLMGLAVASAKPPDNPVIPYVVAYFGVTAAACALAAWPMFRGFWGGVVRRPGANAWAAGVGIAYVGLVGWMMMLMAKVVPDPLRDDTRVFGLVLLMYAAVAWVRHRIAQAELKTAEKLLEIELRLADLGEAVNRPRPNHPSPPVE